MSYKFIIIFLMIFPLSLCAQQQTYPGPAIYVEIGGTGLSWYTANVEKTFFKVGKRFAAAHVGFGAYKQPYIHQTEYSFTKWSVPAGLTLIKGMSKHRSEVGISLTYSSGQQTNSAVASVRSELKKSETLFLIANFGYRFQKPDGGFLLRLQLTPVIRIKEFVNDPEFRSRNAWFIGGGISLGYAFKERKSTSSSN